MKEKIDNMSIFAAAFIFFVMLSRFSYIIEHGIVSWVNNLKETFRMETAIKRHYDYELFFVGNVSMLGSPMQAITIERDFWDNCTFIVEPDVYVIDCDRV